MSYEIEGKIIVKDKVQEVSEKFKKQEFVIEVVNEKNQDWNDLVKFQATQERCSVLDAFNIGDNVKVSFNVRGREWVNKEGVKSYFTNLEAWRVEMGQKAVSHNEPISEPQSTSEANEEDDLPF